MSVLAQLERLDHRAVGMPETQYVFEARKFRLRIAVLVLLTIVSLLTSLKTPVALVGVALAVAAGVQTVLARRVHSVAAAGVASERGRWYETS